MSDQEREALASLISDALAGHRRPAPDRYECRCGARIVGTSPKGERNHQADVVLAALLAARTPEGTEAVVLAGQLEHEGYICHDGGDYDLFRVRPRLSEQGEQE